MSDTGALVYVVDDDISAREGVARLIRSAGLTAKTFVSGEEFLAAGQSKVPDCLILDVNLPGLNGLDLQEELAQWNVEIPIVFLSGHGDIPTTVRAVKAGAVNFLTKPFDDEELLKTIRQCIKSHSEEFSPPFEFEGIVGNSSAIKKVFQQVSIVAQTDSTVLLHGETGTGKELIARAIHRRSDRRSRGFVSLNCAAIPRELIASELFGHEKGAFTGATQQRLGRFELASGGTLFLDEVGELPHETQIALLRVLQEHEFERLGGSRAIRADVRVIAATNRDLEAAVANGIFRQDLFYRLNVFPIELPPLRDRREDIPILVEYFIGRFARKAGKSLRTINKKSLHLLQSCSWPGNIRELQNVIERSVIVCETGTLSVDQSWISPQSLTNVRSNRLDFSGKLAAQEKEMIEAVLRETEGQVFGPLGAAAKLGMARSTLESKIRSLKINKNLFKILATQRLPKSHSFLSPRHRT